MRSIAFLFLVVALAGCTSPETAPLDSDNDGHPDAAEKAAGSDPHDPASVPGGVPQEPALPGPVWGSLDVAIRPGAPIGWCTYNFLFYAPGNDTYYVGTAAHCTDAIGQRMPLSGFMDEIGTVVYDSDNATQGGPNADFSLVLLDEGLNLQANPTMMNLQGPTGFTTSADVSLGDAIEHHGYGMFFGDRAETRDREGIVSGWSGGVDKDYCSESPIWWGDSGSPIIHQKTQKAFGIVSRAGWTACMPSAQLMGATLPYIFDEMAEYGWTGIELATI